MNLVPNKFFFIDYQQHKLLTRSRFYTPFAHSIAQLKLLIDHWKYLIYQIFSQQGNFCSKPIVRAALLYSVYWNNCILSLSGMVLTVINTVKVQWKLSLCKRLFQSLQICNVLLDMKYQCFSGKLNFFSTTKSWLATFTVCSKL